MIKLVPTAYYPMLINNYNKLFASARWDRQWKCSRLLCFNKVLSPVPKTSQLRPINLLPVFSKIYEKLFLLRFHQWLNQANILPSQQSGSRQHQSTATRVQKCLRIIYCLQYTTNIELHETWSLPTLQNRFQRIIQKRLTTIQNHEMPMLRYIHQYQQIKITLQKHFTLQKCIPHLLIGRPRKRTKKFYQNDTPTLFDKLLDFCNK
ncbi:unnamed protein product [Rotaria sp. Silwood1]|nr:unnamed protein product [Rotaria sp. Silwood1]